MPVLGTKLHLPTSRRPLVPRARITDRLSVEAGVDAAAGAGLRTGRLRQDHGHDPVALVDGAGTTGERRRVAWLSLDEGDSDLRRFLTHLVAALQTTSPDLGAEALALMTSDRTLPTEEVLVSLVNDLDIAADPPCWRSTTTTSSTRACRP